MKIIRIAQSKLNLPPIPDGMVRLTHFTASTYAIKNVMNGDNFDYGGGMAQTTTDAFSDNQKVLNLIEEGTYPTGLGGNFDRAYFGSNVILMDIPFDEHKKLLGVTAITEGIPNGYVLGYVDRKTMSFHPNSGYSPANVPPLETKEWDALEGLVEEGLVEIPQPTSQPPPSGDLPLSW